jgi:hypothetical protein
MQRRRWSDLSPAQRRVILALISLQLSLLATALADLLRRPAEQINGPRWAWALASLVSFVGPLAYFRFGRKATSQEPTAQP